MVEEEGRNGWKSTPTNAVQSKWALAGKDRVSSPPPFVACVSYISVHSPDTSHTSPTQTVSHFYQEERNLKNYKI